MRTGFDVSILPAGSSIFTFGPISDGSLVERITLFLGGGASTVLYSVAVFDSKPTVVGDFANARDPCWQNVTVPIGIDPSLLDIAVWRRMSQSSLYISVRLENLGGSTVIGGVFAQIRVFHSMDHGQSQSSMQIGRNA